MTDTLVQILGTLLGAQSLLFTVEQILETVLDYRLVAMDGDPIPFTGTLKMRIWTFIFALFIGLWLIILRGQVVHVS